MAGCLVPAAGAEETPLADYSLEQLMELDVAVTSAGRKTQRLEDTAAAVYVITQEDIRHSGMTTLPELLRLAPGLQVGQIDGSTWAVGSRGFAGRYSNKLLVQLDGRTLYTPSFSGVYWDAQEVALEDIEKIEVIRGPGGTLWGANAVNGVVSITTRPAAATQGWLASGGAGNYEHRQMARYGGKIGEDGHFRIHAGNSVHDDFQRGDGAPAHDRRDMRSAGFRADWAFDSGDAVTLQGDAYDGNSDYSARYIQLAPPAAIPQDFSNTLKGGNLLLRWKRVLSVGSEWSLQFYYDGYERQDAKLGEKRDTYDVDFQRRHAWGERHDIVWGLGWRRTSDEMADKFHYSFFPLEHRDDIVSAFIQDEIALAGERLHLVMGAKLEHNEHTGLEHQPNLRLRWKIDERQMGWAALSRAVRTPSRADLGVAINYDALPGNARSGGAPYLVRILGNPGLQAENLLAYEAGYRVRPSAQVSLEAAVFYNEYDHLMTLDPAAPFYEAGSPARVVVPLRFQNKAGGTSHGMELSGSWQPSPKWTFKAGYSWMKSAIRLDPDSADAYTEARNGWVPRQQLQFFARHALDGKTDLSASLYYVDRLPSQNVAAYARLDLRWGWRPRRGLEVSVAARNLLDSRHPEFVTFEGPRTSEAPRSLYGAATWRF